MSVVATTEGRTAPSRVARRTTPAAALASLGIVYGDLGTSPLYTLQTVIQTFGGQFTPEAALGVLSLILRALVITISVKYCLFVMPADNHGEGGILALHNQRVQRTGDKCVAPVVPETLWRRKRTSHQ
jgi:KUP system potassium uptake protein